MEDRSGTRSSERLASSKSVECAKQQPRQLSERRLALAKEGTGTRLASTGSEFDCGPIALHQSDSDGGSGVTPDHGREQ